MHEFSMMQQVVSCIVDQAKKYGGITGIEEVTLEVGELTFLGHEQLQFCFGILSEEQELLRGAKLIIVAKKSLAQCPSCGYKGPLDHMETDSEHVSMPIFACPDCGDAIDVIAGRECSITNIRAVVDESASPCASRGCGGCARTCGSESEESG